MKRSASDAFEVVRELDTAGNEVAKTANVRIVVPSTTDNVPSSAPHLPRDSLSPLERIAQEIECAAADGNMPLVRERLQTMLQSCSIATATSARRSKRGGDDDDAKRSPGGFEYRPEYLLLVVIMADRLHPSIMQYFLAGMVQFLPRDF